MRQAAPIVVLALALSGCASVRHSLGEYQKAADKGVTFGGGPDHGGPTDANVTSGGTKPGKPTKQELPTGLGGDKAHAEYTAPQG